MTEPTQLPGDDNVERLVGQAYRPDPIDPSFVRRVHARLDEVAAERRSVPPRLSRRRLLAVVGGLAAVVALIVLPQALWSLLVTRTAEVARTAPPENTDRQSPPPLTVLPRGRTPTLETLAPGSEVHTGAGQRRRVRLPDGSLLSLNENTAARLDADRRLTLSKGEVFVEVAPRSSGERRERFIVHTPQREVIALGTKFAVRADRAGTGVLVTQGKVEVGGLGRILVAGQQLVAGAVEVSPAGRASHALAWTRDLMAQTAAPLVPASAYRGGALVAIGPDGQPNRLSLRKYHVDVHIEDGFARTTIDQTYFNAHSGRLEGTFHFPLPADASLSRLAMYVDGTRMEGGMVERDYGRAVYQGIVNRMKDPALLEWVDGTTFKMRVFPLEGRQEKRIILSYTQKLPTLYGRATYRFPAGHSLEAVRDWSFLARVKDGAKLPWHSPTHELKSSLEKNDLLLTAAAQATRVQRDVVLDLEVPAPGDSVRFSSAEHDGARYLMLRYRPTLPLTAQQAKVKRRDWVFLFESSAERDPLLARTQIEILRNLLENTGHDDTFAIVTAGTRCRLLTPRPLAASAANVRKLLASLETTHFIGALDLEKALATAAPLLKATRNPHLVHVGSGLPRLGERRPEVLLRKLPAGTRYVGVGVGKRWNRAFMKAAADASGGYFTQINPDEVVTWRAFDLLATLNTPRLLNVRVEAADGKLPFLMHAATLAQGEELCAVARVEGKGVTWPAAVVVRGTLDGKPFRRRFAVAKVVPKADYLPRTWGRLEIDRLLAEGAQPNKERIIALSKSLYVMSPFTSLLVLENEAMYKQYNVERGRKDHWALYRCPDRIPIVTEPLYGPPLVATRISFNSGAESWSAVFQRLGRQTGKPVISPYKLPGTFAVRPPAKASYTLPEAIDCINEALIDQKYILIQRLRSFTLVPTDEKIDPSLVPQIEIKNLPQYGETEIVRLAVPLKGLNADEMQEQVKRMMGKFSEVAAIPAANQLVLTDTVGSLKRVLQFLQPVGQHDPQSVLRTLVLPGRDVDVEGFHDLGIMVIRGENVEEHQRLLEQIKDLIRNQPRLQARTEQWRRDPPLSPYLNLLRGGDPAANYFLGVRPEQQRRTDTTVRMQSLETGIDPTLVQQAMDAVLGRGTSGSAGAPDGPPLTLPPPPGSGRGQGGSPELPDVAGTGMMGIESIGGYSGLRYVPGGFAGRSGSTRQSMEDSLGYYPANLALVVRGTSLIHSKRRQAQQDKVVVGADIRAARELFRDLVSFAPGMDTTAADVLAVLEAEASLPFRSRPGKVAAAARTLIDRARAAGWEAVALPGVDGVEGFTILCDGQGRYHCERDLDTALRERIVCDGKTLLHLYPELGLGARRNVSRFHRRDLSALVPWLLPPADDLAQGADLELVNKQTVAVLPHAGTVCLHLVFATDGRLAEKRLLSRKSGRLLERQTYAADGTVRRFDARGKLLSEERLTRRAAKAPDLKPDLKQLVVLPLPWRKRNARQSDKLATLASLFAEKDATLRTFVTEHFLDKGDRRIGFLTLLAAGRDPDKALARRLDSKSKLGDYLLQFDGDGPKQRAQDFRKKAATDFLSRMKALYRLHNLCGAREDMSRDGEERLLGYVRQCKSPRLLWSLVQTWSVGQMPRAEGTGPAKLRPRVLELAAQGLRGVPGLAYAARYEHARCLLHGNKPLARKLFEELYAETLASGVLPRIDADFRRALEDGDRGTGPWRATMRRTAERWLKAKDPLTAIAVVAQCWVLGDVELGDELVQTVLVADAPAEQRARAMLTAVALLSRQQREVKADELLAGLLARQDAPRDPELWRVASRLANSIDGLRRSLAYLEKAVELQWENPPDLWDLQAVRSDCGQLLASYGRLAQAAADLGQRPPAGLTERVVWTADRWRSLDRGGPAAEKAADVLLSLGERELAWDYLTVWLGSEEETAKGWRDAAENLRLRREYELADRALAAAAALEQR